MNLRALFQLSLLCAVLSLAVSGLGSYVRLSNAGLSCPDWPLCYGTLSVPLSSGEIKLANRQWPDRPVDPNRAWKEVGHRYLAGILGLLVLALATLTLFARRRGLDGGRIAYVLAVLVVLQVLLGMLTVVWKVAPLIVVAHLYGGFALTALAALNAVRLRPPGVPGVEKALFFPVALALLLVIVQIGLGGWVSTHYSAFVCVGFPTCRGQWWPEANFAEGFSPWFDVGRDYEGGVLSLAGRTAIHQTHRIFAFVCFAALIWLWLRLLRLRLVRSSVLVLGLLLAQLILGIVNAVEAAPLWAAVPHNTVAALLLLVLLLLLERARLAASGPPAQP